MNLSAKVEYASIAVLELAAHWGSDEPLRIRDIADAHGIPSRFLVQILLQLKGAGLVQSTRGSTGGYWLARSPEQISLADVIAVIEGPAAEIQSNVSRSTPATSILLAALNEVATVERSMLEQIRFDQLAERLRTPADAMYHI